MKKDEYDVIIIGAGIGGLVCGCYLAKAGKKVLIVEKNDKVGGCCTSFDSNRYVFNTCVHSIGSCRKDGYVNNILNELNLAQSIAINKYDPSDLVRTPECDFYFDHKGERLKESIKKSFNTESGNFNNFLNFIHKPKNFIEYYKLHKVTFEQLLDNYIKNYKLKQIIALPVFGNGGLPASKISAVAAVMILKEFILDGGYYIKNGFQSFSNSIAKRAVDFGAEILYLKAAKKVKIQPGVTPEVILSNGDNYFGKKIIFNCSIYDVFYSILDRRLSNAILKKMQILTPSLSMYSIYLGMKSSFDIPADRMLNMWNIQSFNIEKSYKKILDGNIADDDIFFVIYASSFLDKTSLKTVYLLVNAPYKEPDFWNNKSEIYSNRIINKAEAALPGLKENIRLKIVSTPQTIMRYTSNYQGASYGWAPTKKQFFNMNILNELINLENLYFVGHWTSKGFGVPSVMYQGMNIAKRIINGADKR